MEYGSSYIFFFFVLVPIKWLILKYAPKHMILLLDFIMNLVDMRHYVAINGGTWNSSFLRKVFDIKNW